MAQEAPHWAPNAVATSLGWTDATSGELLIAVEGLEVAPAVIVEEAAPVTE
jgi:hypothetical protein